MSQTLRQWLSKVVFTREQIDRFLDPSQPSWARFDRELGYVGADCMVQDGLDGSFSIYRYETDGARKCINFRDRPCRIHSYGDSFTQCHQVSDGETWQEYLAAHLGEPIRNYGVGGYGVYQAYRRLLQTEQIEGAPNIVFYLWGDDHHRSLMPCRYIFIHQWYDHLKIPIMFHSTPWAHLAVDLSAGGFQEVGNLFPTPESLYQLCDPDRLYEAFSGNLIVQLAALADGISNLDMTGLRQLAEWADSPLDLDSAEKRQASAHLLYTKVAHLGTIFLLDKLAAHLAQNQKKLLVVLGYGAHEVRRALEGDARSDQAIIGYLQEKGLRHFDALAAHVSDYQGFKPEPDSYLARYYIGHYSPRGNHFFAYAIKDVIVDWLDPKPVSYQPL